jgi:four helix bundle protein
LGSAAELETQLVIAKEIGFISYDELNDMSEKLDHVSKMMSSLLRKIG